MITTISNDAEIVGKTIKSTYRTDGEFYIRFTDGTVLYLEADENSQGFCIRLPIINTWETILRKDDVALYELGFTTRAEYEEAEREVKAESAREWAASMARQKLEYDERERTQYLELKKKYGE